MKYQSIRIVRNGKPTYGDKYQSICSENELKHNEIIVIGNDKYLILFQEEVDTK